MRQIMCVAAHYSVGRFGVVLDNSRCMAQPVMSLEQAPAVSTANFVLSAVAPLCGAKDLEELPSRLAEAAAVVLGTRQTFAMLCDRVTRQPDLASLCSPAQTAYVRGFLQNYRAPQSG